MPTQRFPSFPLADVQTQGHTLEATCLEIDGGLREERLWAIDGGERRSRIRRKHGVNIPQNDIRRIVEGGGEQNCSVEGRSVENSSSFIYF